MPLCVQMEEYFALSRKDLFIEISPKEIQLIHSLLLKYIDNLVSSTMQVCVGGVDEWAGVDVGGVGVCGGGCRGGGVSV